MQRHNLSREHIAEAYSRGSGLCSPDDVARANIAIVGAGGIGSYVALALAKLGASSLAIWDDDTVELGNTSAQVYGAADIGRHKVDALAEHIERTAPIPLDVHANRARVMPDTTLPDYVFSCVDSMAARSMIYASVKRDGGKLYDGRIGRDIVRAFAVDTSDESEREYYESTLYTDESGVELPCAERNVAYVAYCVTAFMTSLFASDIRADGRPREIMAKLHDYSFIPIVCETQN